MSYQLPSTGLHNFPWETEKSNWISYCQILMDPVHVRKIKVLREIAPSWLKTAQPQGTLSNASVFCLPLCSGDTAAVQLAAEGKKAEVPLKGNISCGLH